VCLVLVFFIGLWFKVYTHFSNLKFLSRFMGLYHSVSKQHDIPVFKIFASTLLFWGLSLTGLGILFFLNNYTAPKVLLFIGLFTVFFSSIILFTKYLKDTNGNIRGQILRIIIWFSLGLYCLLSWFSMT